MTTGGLIKIDHVNIPIGQESIKNKKRKLI